MAIPRDATFRRAEGLTFFLDSCQGFDVVNVMAKRQGGDIQKSVTRADLRILGRMSSWQTADELGVPFFKLSGLVDRKCAFWSRARPARTLVGAPLDKLEGKIALRENVFPRFVLDMGAKKYSLFPLMPRTGSLDHAKLAGIMLQQIELEQIVGVAMFVCCEKHAHSMRDLLLKLDGSHDVDELSRDKDHAAFLKVLDDLGYLTRREPPPAMDGKPRLTWLAHAGVVYESCGKRIAIDPSAYPIGEPTRWAVNPVNLGKLNPIDAVLITHGDNDHFSPNMLIRFPPKTPIVIPKAKAVKPYHVDMKRMLALCGMENVIEVEDWQELKFGDVKVVATPFRGEDWGLDLPTSTFYVTSPDLTIFANADSTSDEEAYTRLAKDYPRIDVAFLGVTGAAESYAMPPGFGYGDFYVKWIPEARHEEWVELCNGPPQSVAAAKLLNARYAFGYAAGGAPFYTCAYSDRGTHTQFAKLLLESGGPTKPLDFEVGVARSVPSA